MKTKHEKQCNLPVFLDVYRAVVVVYSGLCSGTVVCAPHEIRATHVRIAVHGRIFVLRRLVVGGVMDTRFSGRLALHGRFGVGRYSWCCRRGCRLRRLLGLIVAVDVLVK